MKLKDIKKLAYEAVNKVDEQHGLPLIPSSCWIEGFVEGYIKAVEKGWTKAQIGMNEINP